MSKSGSREIMNGDGGMERAKGTMESGSSTGKWADGSLDCVDRQEIMVPANHFPNMHDIPEEIAEEGKKDENDAQNEEENKNVVVVPAPNIIAEGEMTVQPIGRKNQGIVVEVTEPVNVGAALNVSFDGDSEIAGYKGKSIADICTCPFHYHPLRRGYEEMKAGGDGMPYNPSPGVKKPNAKAPSPDVGVQLYAEKISEAPVQVEEGEEEDIDAEDDNEDKIHKGKGKEKSPDTKEDEDNIRKGKGKEKSTKD